MNMLQQPLTSQDIEAIIPHRYPFLLVDRVSEIIQGVSIKAYKNLTKNEAFFQGHYPDFPVMPGVLAIEALAQAAAILSCYGNDLINDDAYIFLLASVDYARFKRAIVPGDRLDLDVKLLKSRSNLNVYEGEGSVDGQLAISVGFKCMRKAKA